MTKILFFAELREKLNCSAIELELTQTSTIKEIIELLILQHPHWQSIFAQGSVLSAVNQTMVAPDSVVQPGDEVAFFPPVTGG